MTSACGQPEAAKKTHHENVLEAQKERRAESVRKASRRIGEEGKLEAVEKKCDGDMQADANVRSYSFFCASFR